MASLDGSFRTAKSPPPQAAAAVAAVTKEISEDEKRKQLKLQRFNEEMKSLNEEMDIAVYATNRYGRARRRVTRQEAVDRTIKRKQLEKEDAIHQSVEVDVEAKRQKMRGSMAALELGDEALSTLIRDEDFDIEDPEIDIGEDPDIDDYAGDTEEDDEEDNDDDEDDGSDSESDSGDAREKLKLRLNQSHDTKIETSTSTSTPTDRDRDRSSVTIMSKSERENVAGESSYHSEKKRIAIENNEELPENSNTQTTEEIERYKKVLKNSGKRVTRKVFRLRNFTSHRLAQRHGEALGAHALGKQRKAVEKLGEVAERAPAAPQIYSSLGLVYECLLADAKKETIHSNSNSTSTDNQIKDFSARLELGKKTYGSYHVAALLCKKDYTLWVRAADAACDIADMHTEAMTRFPSLMDNNREEKLKWLSEAKHDYHMADNLHPPGITVPAKLAFVQMQLGNLSEALTILTDLRNNSLRPRPAPNPYRVNWRKADIWHPRSELERSHTAWLLYSDLMLRVGHECHQWNLKRSQNDNYMFKRWLRKYSHSFDWKERRLQALCLALEAACGSEACTKVVEWMKIRNRNAKEKRGEALGSIEEEGRWHIDNYEAEAKEDAKDSELSEKDKDMTNEKNTDVDIDKVKDQPKEIDTDNHTNQHDEQSSFNQTEQSDRKVSPLPMSASFASVCHVASQLMKHCLGMEIFDCAVLVAEALVAYQKARLSRRAERLRQRQMFQRGIRGQELLAPRNETHDRIKAETDESDEDDQIILSDDNEVDNIDNSSLLHSLSKGSLPPELQTLYALSLVGQGGKDYLAWTILLDVIPQLEVETVQAVEDDLLDTEITPDNAWVIFRRAAISPTRRTQAILLLSDLIAKIGKTEEWSRRLARLIRSHVKTLEDKNDLLALRPVQSQESHGISLIRNQHVKLILALARMYLHEAKQQQAVRKTTYMDGKDSKAFANETLRPGKLALTVIELMVRFRNVLWKNASKDGSIHPNSNEMLKLLAGAFPIVIESKNMGVHDDIKHESISDLLAKLRHFVSLICKISLGSEDIDNSEILDLGDSFPIPHGWQSNIHKQISLRSYNLCVGCNVSTFSGWENEEFSLNLLQKRDEPTFFGVKIGGNHVAGYLPEQSEEELSNQWSLLDTLVSNAPLLDFNSSLYMAKKAVWYTSAKKKLETFGNTKIAVHGEDYAIYILLTYSRLCLFVASNEDNHKGEEFLKIPLSIILPMTQYCLDQRIWDSSIGTGAATTDGPEEWEEFIKTMTRFDANTTNQTTDTLPTKSNRLQRNLRSITRQSKKSSVNPMKFKQNTPYTPKVISIPATELLRKWTDPRIYGVETKTQESMSSATETMKKLDVRMRQLRSCFTVQALQKVSIHVAAALLDVAAEKDCYNPFLCLHQAAMFAGQGAKGGNSDVPFKKLLPPKNTCTELEALIILGRADCMRALAFTDQAMFLCTFVAEVCRLHRDESKYEYVWNGRWVVVGIQMYKISVAIDRTIESIPEGDVRKTTVLDWDDDVKAEIERGKADAASVFRAFNIRTRSSNGNFVSDINRKVGVSEGQQDYSSDDEEQEEHEQHVEKEEHEQREGNNDNVITNNMNVNANVNVNVNVNTIGGHGHGHPQVDIEMEPHIINGMNYNAPSYKTAEDADEDMDSDDSEGDAISISIVAV